MKPTKTLHLTLSARPFEVMVTEEKGLEFRKPSDWIKSRLYGKEYDFVKFTHGYGKNKPWFISEYEGYFIADSSDDGDEYKYSNGLKVKVEAGDYVIMLGQVVDSGNLKTTGRPGC